MPKKTLAQLENEIRQDRQDLPRTTVRRLAKRQQRELALWEADTPAAHAARVEAHLDRLAGRTVHQFSDPTPRQALAQGKRKTNA